MKNENRNEINVPLEDIIDIVRTHDRIFIYSTNPNLSDEEIRYVAEVEQNGIKIKRCTIIMDDKDQYVCTKYTVYIR